MLVVTVQKPQTFFFRAHFSKPPQSRNFPRTPEISPPGPEFSTHPPPGSPRDPGGSLNKCIFRDFLFRGSLSVVTHSWGSKKGGAKGVRFFPVFGTFWPLRKAQKSGIFAKFPPLPPRPRNFPRKFANFPPENGENPGWNLLFAVLGIRKKLSNK